MLDEERETFARALPHLGAEEGRYALVKGDRVEGVFDSFRDAIQVGYDRFGLEPFMVKRVEAVETVHFIPRAVFRPCIALTLLATLCGVLVGCGGGTDARVARLFGGADGVAAVRAAGAAGTVEAYRMEGAYPSSRGDALAADRGVGGMPFAGGPGAGPVALPPAAARRLAGLLTDPASFGFDYVKACLFRPDVAFRFSDAAGTGGLRSVDVVVCFSCDEVQVYPDGRTGGGEDVDAIRPALLAAARAAFPDAGLGEPAGGG